jgi:hypothetical protein
MSAKILREARAQQAELDLEDAQEEDEVALGAQVGAAAAAGLLLACCFTSAPPCGSPLHSGRPAPCQPALRGRGPAGA